MSTTETDIERTPDALAEEAAVVAYLRARQKALCRVAYGREERWASYWRCWLGIQGAALSTATPEHAAAFLRAMAGRCSEERRRLPGRLRALHTYLIAAGVGGRNPFGEPSVRATRCYPAPWPRRRSE